MERNQAAARPSCARHSWAWQNAWLLLRFFPFPVGSPVAAPCTCTHFFMPVASRRPPMRESRRERQLTFRSRAPRRQIVLHYRLLCTTPISALWRWRGMPVSRRSARGLAARSCIIAPGMKAREREGERGRERASGTAPLRPSDTNFSWKDICSTCSSHLSLSRLYIPFLARSLEQAAKETEGFLKKDDCRLKMFKEYAEFSALLFAAAALQGHNRNTEF